MNFWTPKNSTLRSPDLNTRRNTKPVTPIISEKNYLNPPSNSKILNSPLTSSPKSITLDSPEALSLLGRIKKIQEKITITKSQIISSTEVLVNFVSNLKKKALNEVLEAEFEIQALSLKLEKGQCVEMSFLSKINSISLADESTFLNFDQLQEGLKLAYKISEEFKNVSTLRKSIKRMSSFDEIAKQPIRRSKTDISEYKGVKNILICAKDYKNGLIAIDLLTLFQTPLKFAPKILPYSICCQVDEFRYFFNGGYTGEKITGDCFLVNFSTKTFEILQSSVERDGGGSVFKDNKVFVFGGIHSKVKDLALCQYFDLLKKKWLDITPLPIPSHANSAALLEDWILLTGYHLSGVYIYTGDSYTSLISLPEKRFKYIFENWVIDGKNIYELQDLANNLWVSFDCGRTLKLGWLYSFAGFRNGKNIYFADDANGVCRLNTDKKAIEVVVNLEKA